MHRWIPRLLCVEGERHAGISKASIILSKFNWWKILIMWLLGNRSISPPLTTLHLRIDKMLNTEHLDTILENDILEVLQKLRRSTRSWGKWVSANIEQWRTLKPFCRMRSIILRTSDPKAVLIIWEPGGTTCIGCKLGDLISISCHVIIYWNMSHQVAPIALDENLATTWHHLHWEQLALIENLAIRQHLLHWLKIRPSCSCPPPPCPPCPDHHV